MASPPRPRRSVSPQWSSKVPKTDNKVPFSNISGTFWNFKSVQNPHGLWDTTVCQKCTNTRVPNSNISGTHPLPTGQSTSFFPFAVTPHSPGHRPAAPLWSPQQQWRRWDQRLEARRACSPLAPSPSTGNQPRPPDPSDRPSWTLSYNCFFSRHWYNSKHWNKRKIIEKRWK